jgi:hypothetical protein
MGFLFGFDSGLCGDHIPLLEIFAHELAQLLRTAGVAAMAPGGLARACLSSAAQDRQILKAV